GGLARSRPSLSPSPEAGDAAAAAGAEGRAAQMVRPRPYRDAGAGRDSRLGAWEFVYYKQDAATPGFSLFPREGQHKGAYCVWELGPVWHEQQAWVRFL